MTVHPLPLPATGEQTEGPWLLKIREGAPLLGHSPSYVYRLVREGETFGGSVIDTPMGLRFSRKRLEAYCNGQAAAS